MKFMRLALRNVKKSYKDYFVYFLTLMFSVCLFYTFNSFSAQEEILQLSTSQSTVLKTTGQLMNVLSVFVAIVLAFLILYANNFLIRRRKQEFGIYMLLGMPKWDISRVLVYETWMIGMLSLLSGLFLGTICSQLLGMFSAGMLHAVYHFSFVFSASSAWMTMVSFTVIFVVIMLLNTRVISKIKLIDLLQSKKKMEKARIHGSLMSVLVFILSLLLIGTAYFLATYSLELFALLLVPILILGGIGTILFFMSLSGFLLLFIRLSKRIYYRNLHMVVLRQIHAKISSVSLSMGIVCLMLLLAIGALSCGFSLHHTLLASVEKATPYSYTYLQNEGIREQDMKRLLMLEKSEQWNRVSIYQDETTLRSILPYVDDANKDILYPDAAMEYVSLSDYNTIMRSQGKPLAFLQDNEAFFISGEEDVVKSLQDMAKQHRTITVFDQKLQLKEAELTSTILSNDYSANVMLAVVVKDDVLKQQKPVYTYWNVDLPKTMSSAAYSEEVQSNFNDYRKQYAIRDYHYSGATREEIEESIFATGMLFVYIGLYLGIVFLVSSAAVLALQQLSDADDNKTNYDVLRKIGTQQKMIDHSILQQIAVYFLLPLGLAIVHASVGVPVVSNAFSFLYKLQDMWKTNLMTASIIIFIYGSYFLITYHGYRMAIQIPKHNEESIE